MPVRYSNGTGPAEVVEKFVYNGQHIAMVFDDDGTLTHRYMYRPGIDMNLADEAFDGTSGNFLDLYWMLGDHQGSVTSVLSHNSGQTSVVQQLAYTAFGAIGSIQDGQGNNLTTGPISRFAYTGREFDPETGDYYYRARYYDPQSGRFRSQDPIGFAAGDMNLYRYVGNSSPNFVDPSGLRADGRMIGQQPRPNVPIGPVRYNDGSPRPQGSLPGFTPQGDDQRQQYWTTNGIMPTGGLPPSDPTIVTLPTGGQFPGPTSITLPGGTVVPFYPEPMPPLPPIPGRPGKPESEEPKTCPGYVDIGVSWFPGWAGFVGGVFVTSDYGIYPYFGGGLGSPGASANVFFSNQTISQGKISIQFTYIDPTNLGSGGAIGMDQDHNVFCEVGPAIGTPGGSRSAYYTSEWTVIEWIVYPIYWFVRQ